MKITRRTKLLVVALALCFTTMIGSTFAWFTDSAESAVNTIEAGNLDMVVEYKTSANGEWATLTESTKLFKEDALYEPGYTEIVFLRVANAGNLAFKYNLAVSVEDTAIGKSVLGNDIKLSNYLDIGIYMQDEYSSGFNYADILLPNMFSDRASALDNVKENMTNLSEKNDDGLVTLAANAPVLAGEQTSQVAVLVLTMPTTVGNDANHNGTDIPKINLGVNVVATQYTEEIDGFANNQYDADAEYPAILSYATKAYESSLKPGAFTLARDFNTSDSDKHYSGNREYAITGGRDYTLNLNGHTLNHDGTYQDGKNTGYTYLYTTAYNGKLTINGEGTIKSVNTEGSACIVYAQGPSEVVINGGDFEAIRGVPVWAGNNSKVTINGGSFISSGSNNEELIYSSGGVIDIFGGFFHNTGWENRPVNVANANRGTGFINIHGGTFVNFDPSTGGDDPSNIKVMDGYKVVSETQANGDIWYTVVPQE